MAVHVHHGLQDQANQWTDHCTAYCHKIKTPLTVIHVDARPMLGDSPEEAARNRRYEAFASLIKPGEVLMLAQHQDDQAETLLLQLFRGAGPRGLSAMPVRSVLGNGHILRPLLDVPRADILQFGIEKGLTWIEDPSNQDTRFDRNFVRHEVLPLIHQRWPRVEPVIARSARHLADTEELLESVTEEVRRTIIDGACLDIEQLTRQSLPFQRDLVRRWIRSLGFRAPSTKVLDRIFREAVTAQADRSPIIAWPEGQIRRYRGKLYLLHPDKTFDQKTILFLTSTVRLIEIPEINARYTLVESAGEGIALEQWNAHQVTVRFRQGGERIRLFGRGGHHDLRKLFQEAGVAPWIRDTMPLFYLGDQLAAVGDLWVDEAFSAKPENITGLRLQQKVD